VTVDEAFINFTVSQQSVNLLYRADRLVQVCAQVASTRTPTDTSQLTTGLFQCAGPTDMTAIAAGTAAAISMRIGIVNHTNSETMC